MVIMRVSLYVAAADDAMSVTVRLVAYGLLIYDTQLHKWHATKGILIAPTSGEVNSGDLEH
jgi:hypothetical protein